MMMMMMNSGQNNLVSAAVNTNTNRNNMFYCVVCVNMTTGGNSLAVQRSKTSVPLSEVRPQFYIDLERQARAEAERAMRVSQFATLNFYLFFIYESRQHRLVRKVILII